MTSIYKWPILGLSVIFLFFLQGVCFAGKVIILRNGKEKYSIGKFTQILKDPLLNKNIDSIAFGVNSNEFKDLNFEETDIGHTRDAVWIRFTVINKSTNDNKWILSEGFPIIDRVDFYIPSSDGKFEVLTSGVDFPMSSRRLKSRKIIFPFNLKTGEQKTFYIRFQSRIMLPVYLKIWKPEVFAENQTKEYLIFGIFYGALLLMSFYNLLLYFFIKDKSFLYFSLYGLALCIYQTCVDGLFFRFISPDYTLINTHIFNVIIGLVGFFFTLFVKEFIQVRKYSAVFNNLLITTSAVFLFYALILSVVSARFASSVSFLPIIGGNTIILASAAYCLIKGDKNARIFLIAMLIFLAGFFFRHLNYIEYVHGTVGDELTLQIGFIGVFLAMTFLSFAMGNRFNSIKIEEEREKALIRSRIASDLHDEIGSNLSSISLSSQMMKEAPSLNLKQKKQLEDITLTAKETAQSIRDIIWFVDPEHDKSEDLILKMKNAASMLLTNINFSFKGDEGKIKIPENLQIRRNLFLIFKEILNNIAKHSQADAVDITIKNKAEELKITVSDNGLGFESDKVKYGYGIKNIRNRINEMGGGLKIESSPGRGTRIEISLYASERPKISKLKS